MTVLPRFRPFHPRPVAAGTARGAGWRAVIPTLVIPTLVMAACLAGAPARAQEAEAIIKALSPRPPAPVVVAPTSGAGAAGSGAGGVSAAGSPTRGYRPTRGVSVEGGTEQAVREAEEMPSIDLFVPFEYNQSSLTLSDARLMLDALGAALQDPRLIATRFEIIGHTDAKGSDAFNQRLSQRRAEAVRAYLMQFHQVAAGRLSAAGLGETRLKDPAHPEDGVNRRVEVRALPD